MRTLRSAGIFALSVLLASCGSSEGPPAKPQLTVEIVSARGGGSGTVSGSGMNCEIAGNLQSGTCIKDFDSDADVALATVAQPGSVFAGWSGACTGTGTCFFKPSAGTRVTANFVLFTNAVVVQPGAGTGNGTISGNGINCTVTANQLTGTCTQTLVPSTNVTLTATPATNHVFAGWGAECTGTALTCQFTMAQPRAVTPVFRAPTTLTVRSGAGDGNGTVTGGGITCTVSAATESGACAVTVPDTTTIVLTATPAAGGNTFGGWGGACSGSGTATTCSITMAQARSVTARFNAPIILRRLTVRGVTSTGTGTVAATITGGTNVACTVTAGTASGTCAVDVREGSSVTLTATAAAGNHSFTGWGGACTANGVTPQCTFTVPASAVDVTVAFTAPVPITVNGTGNTGSGRVTGTGIDCVFAGTTTPTGTCSGTAVQGALLRLTAAPSAGGNTFVGWSGDCTGSALTCDLTMSQARTVSARFAPPAAQYTITVRPSGTGVGTVTINGATCSLNNASFTGTCSLTANDGTSVTLAATPAANNSFQGWGGACAGTAGCTVTLNANLNVTALFAPINNFGLQVSAGSGTGTGTISGGGLNCTLAGTAAPAGTCSNTFTDGTAVTLTATPITNHTFLGWSGSCAGTGTCALSMTAARTVSANFAAPVTATVAAAAGNTGSGVVSGNGINCNISGSSASNVCSALFPVTQSITLTATPSTNHTFTGWSGDCGGASSTCTLTMATARSIQATFVPPQTLTVSNGGGAGAGSVTASGINCTLASGGASGTCSSSYALNAVVTLTATANSGSVFSTWGGACSGSATSCTVTMSQARSVTASFVPAVSLTVTASGNGGGTMTGAGLSCSISYSGGSSSVGGTCATTVASGSTVVLSGTAGTNFTFEGCSSGTNSGVGAASGTCTLTVSGNTVVAAKFNAPSWSTIYSTFASSCASGCHSTLTTSALWYSYLVNAPTTVTSFSLAVTYNRRVVPNSALTSYTYYQLIKQSGAYGMPTSTTLSNSFVQTFVAWVNGGARQTQP